MVRARTPRPARRPLRVVAPAAEKRDNRAAARAPTRPRARPPAARRPPLTPLRPPHSLAQATTLADRFSVNTQAEHLAAKTVGTGHPDTSRHEWASAIKRDTYALLVGNPGLAAYQAVGEGESVGRVKYNFKQSMLLPCGLPPEREEDE
jgi:splicing factor 3B subunit 5